MKANFIFLFADRRKGCKFSDEPSRLDDGSNLAVARTRFNSRLQRSCTSELFRQRFVSRDHGRRFGRSLWKMALSKWFDKAFRHRHLCVRFLVVHCQHLRYSVKFRDTTFGKGEIFISQVLSRSSSLMKLNSLKTGVWKVLFNVSKRMVTEWNKKALISRSNFSVLALRHGSIAFRYLSMCVCLRDKSLVTGDSLLSQVRKMQQKVTLKYFTKSSLLS